MGSRYIEVFPCAKEEVFAATQQHGGYAPPPQGSQAQQYGGGTQPAQQQYPGFQGAPQTSTSNQPRSYGYY